MAPKRSIDTRGKDTNRKREKKCDKAVIEKSNLKPYKARTKQAEASSTGPVRTFAGTVDEVICTCIPNLLVNVFGRMNYFQRRAVQELGFQGMFHIEVTEIPTNMAYWCLQNFHPVSSSLEIPGKPELHITCDDVFVTLGIPKGNITVKRKGKREKSKLLDEWMCVLGKKRDIKPDDVVDAMLTDVNGEDWFKINFMILVECCIFELSPDRSIKPNITENLYDTSKIKGYNWCSHLLTELFRHHENCMQNKSDPFCGPIFFLVMFYVDRVVHYMRHVPRKFPTVQGWTSAVLIVRAKSAVNHGGFRKGYIDHRYKHDVTTDAADICDFIQEMHDNEGNVDGHTNKGGEGGYEDTCGILTELERHTHDLLCRGRAIADSIDHVISLINDVPTHVKHDECYKIAMESCKKLLGFGHTNHDKSPEVNTKVDKEWKKWKRVDWIESIERMKEVIHKKKQVYAKLEIPKPSQTRNTHDVGFDDILNNTPGVDGFDATWNHAYKISQTDVHQVKEQTNRNVQECPPIDLTQHATDTILDVVKELNFVNCDGDARSSESANEENIQSD